MSVKKHILVVDDDVDARTVVKTILSTSGFQVSDAPGGQDALDFLNDNHLKNNQVDLIILDIMMPGMSGYDVVLRLKQKPETQNIPVMMLTAKGDPDDILAAYKDYAVEYYIPKPFTTKQLTSGVKLVLEIEDEPIEQENPQETSEE